MMTDIITGQAMNLNWIQRILLVFGGLLLLLFAFNTFESYTGSKWLASFLFIAAIGSFVLAASSRRKTDG